MLENLSFEIAEIQQFHRSLTDIKEADGGLTLSGALPFEASSDGYETITECFDVEIFVPEKYPEKLPRTRETGGKIKEGYHHIFDDGTLCLGVPVEERRLYLMQPSLLGFVNNLLIPYLYGYCYWEKHGTHPFDESIHGSEGIVQHYKDLLQLKDEMEILSVISYLYEFGYRGHHPCPCSSGKIVRNCHGVVLRSLNDQHTNGTVRHDFISVFEFFIEKHKEEKIQIPESLRNQLSRILKKTH